jgi:hypothetical protein
MSFHPRQGVNSIVEKSNKHLGEVQETYYGHMKFALYALWMMGSAMVFLVVHLLVPAWFQCHASTRILKLADEMRTRRARLGCGE